MLHVARRAGLITLVAFLSVLLALAGPTRPEPARAQAPAVIPSAGLFTFPGDWSVIPERAITVFYPAQASWEFLTSSEHPGSEQVEAAKERMRCGGTLEDAGGRPAPLRRRASRPLSFPPADPGPVGEGPAALNRPPRT